MSDKEKEFLEDFSQTLQAAVSLIGAWLADTAKSFAEAYIDVRNRIIEMPEDEFQRHLLGLEPSAKELALRIRENK